MQAGGTSVVGQTVAGGGMSSVTLISFTDSIAGPSASIRRNGAALASSTSAQGTGNFTSQTLWVGRRQGTQNPFNGRIYGLIGYTAVLSATDLKAVEDWLNQRAGAF